MSPKKYGLFAIPFIAAIMVGGGLSTQLVAADPDGSNAQSAMITRDYGCMLFNGNDSLTFTIDSQSVVTSSGKSTLKCKADVTSPPDGKAHVMKGFLCNTFLGLTTDTHSVVSASGKSTLICRV